MVIGGVGKSSILSLLQDKVSGEKNAGISNSHCIVFNAWLFQGYEDVKSALMEKVIVELAHLQPKNKKMQELAKSLLKRINWLKVAKMGAGVAFTALSGVPMGALISKAVEKVKEVTQTDSEEKILKPEENQETVTNQIENFRKEFKELIEKSKVEHIIVIVDDLDRCLPKSVIEILEAIRLFLFVEGTTFVLAADEMMIEYAVREHFPNLPAAYSDYTKSYLEKLIQIPIRIPSLNKLQTGNYIRLLMLQNYLKNNTAELGIVYQLYEAKKEMPYDPLELSYEIVKEAINKEDDALKETMMVATQITPTLSGGLRGNPRNIKRFLNTLFLRLKIARIYGLDSVIKLEILAKLMLLERFQPELFTVLTDEVNISSDGVSKSINDGEELVKNNTSDSPSSSPQSGILSSQVFTDWCAIKPPLKAIDLRPYIYISKEKAVGFIMEGSISDDLVEILGKLNSGNTFLLRQTEKELGSLDKQKQLLICEKLEASCRAATDLSRIPAPFQGILRLIKVNPELEERALNMLDIYPTSALGAWVTSEFSGLQGTNSKQKFQQLLQKWSQASDNATLKSIASQTLKKQS